MSEAWEFYLLTLNEDAEPASMRVDLACKASAPIVELPTRVQVRVRFSSPHPDLPLIPEVDKEYVARAEARMIDALSGQGGRYVGRLQTRHFVELFFYVRPGTSVPTIEPSPKGAAVLWLDEWDPEWSCYLTTIYPSALSIRWIENRRVVDALMAAGDQLGVPRPVTHRLLFDDAEGRDAFIAEYAANGFEADLLGDGELSISRVDPVFLDHIHELACRIEDSAERHGGVYDGWESVRRQ